MRGVGGGLGGRGDDPRLFRGWRRSHRIVLLLGQIERSQGKRSHALQGDQVALFEGVGMVGEQFEEAADLARAAEEGQDDDRGDAEGVAGFEVDAGIGLRVVAAQELAAGNALAGQSGTDLQARADRGGAGSGTGAADHFVALGQGERGSSCAGDVLRAFDKQLERSFQLSFSQIRGRIGSATGLGVWIVESREPMTLRQGSVVGLGGSGHSQILRKRLNRVWPWEVQLSRGGRRPEFRRPLYPIESAGIPTRLQVAAERSPANSRNVSSHTSFKR